MRLKSYYAGTVEGAIALARQELGEDIMLIHSRRTLREFAHLGAYEVVFAITSNPPPPVAPGRVPATEKHIVSPELQVAVPDLSYLKVKKELMSLAVSLEDNLDGTPFETISQLLTNQGVHAELIFELLRELRGQLLYTKVDEEKLLSLLSHAMESRVRTETAKTEEEGGTRIAALIGPPGSGKTTTLVKLAAKYGLTSRRPCLLVSADNYRIGASDQLRSFAGILGLSFDTALTPSALGQLIKENKSKDLILIDTPGISDEELVGYEDWAHFFSSRNDIEKHLILSASTKNADLSYVVDRFRVFGPNRLLFTKLDETATQGAIWSEAVRTGMPLSYWTTGQKIPEDIETASKTQLIDAILKQERRPRSATAGM